MIFFRVGSTNIISTANGKRFSTLQIGSSFGCGKIFDVVFGNCYTIKINCSYNGNLCIHVDGSKYTFFT